MFNNNTERSIRHYVDIFNLSVDSTSYMEIDMLYFCLVCDFNNSTHMKIGYFSTKLDFAKILDSEIGDVTFV